MQKKVSLLVILILVALALVACGGGGAATGGASSGGGSVDNGKALFARTTIGSTAGCATCHSLDGSQLVGPSMKGVGTRAGTRVQGQSAEAYLRNAIVDPNAHIVEGFTQGLMPTYKDILQAAELDDLIAYLNSLK